MIRFASLRGTKQSIQAYYENHWPRLLRRSSSQRRKATIITDPMKAFKPILILCVALCFATSCKKDVDMTLKQKTVFENADICHVNVNDGWKVTFVYDSLNTFVELEYSAYLEEYVSVSETDNGLTIGFNTYVYKPSGSIFRATIHTSEKQFLTLKADNASVITLNGHFKLEEGIDIELHNASDCIGFEVTSQNCSLLLSEQSRILGANYHGMNCSVYINDGSCCKGSFDVEDTFTTGVYGQSQLIVFGGSMVSASLEADNAFTINMAQAEVENMYIHLANATEASVNVRDNLSGSLLSASTLYYKGHPQLDIDCSEDSQLIPF